jgi:hypothetical protein
MATKTAQKNTSNTILRSPPSRQAITLELVAAHAPSHALVGTLCSTFGLDAVDYEGIREATKEPISLSAEALQPTVNETAMKIHLQRVVGSFVGSAPMGPPSSTAARLRRPATSPPSSPTTLATRTARGSTGLRAAPPSPVSSPPKRASPPTP